MKKYISLILILIYILPTYSQVNKGEERSVPISEVNFKFLESRAATIDNNVIVKTITYTDSLADSIEVDSFFVYIGDATKVFPIFMIDTTGRSSTGIRPWVSVQVNDIILVDTNFYYTYTNNVLQPFTTIVDTNSITNMTGQYNKLYANVLTTGNDTLTDYLCVKVQVQDGDRGGGGLASRQIKYVLQLVAVLDNRLDEENITLFLLKTAFGDSLNNDHIITGDWIFNGKYVFNDTTYFNSVLMLDSTNIVDSLINILDDSMVVLRNNMIDSAASVVADTMTDLLLRDETFTGKITFTDIFTLNDTSYIIQGTDTIMTFISNDTAYVETRSDGAGIPIVYKAPIIVDSLTSLGTLDHDNPHSFLSAIDSLLTLSADVNVWYHLTNPTGTFFNEIEVDGITVTGDSMIIIMPGDYKGHIGITVTAGVATKQFSIRVTKNGVSIAEQNFTVSGVDVAEGSATFFYINDCNPGDVIAFQIRNITDGTDPVIINAQFYFEWYHK